MPTSFLPVAVSCGDPTGVGLDILLRIWEHRRDLQVPPFYVLADPVHVQAMADRLGMVIPLALLTHPDKTTDIFLQSLPVFPVSGEYPDITIGTPSAQYADITLKSIETAVEHIKKGIALSLMTLPIHKASLYTAGFQSSGHTDFLAKLCGLSSDDVVMMLDAPDVRVVPLTVHLPLRDVPAAITAGRLETSLNIIDRALKKRFPHPRIAVCGLNPHAGEDGHLGSEEQAVIIPTLNHLKNQITGTLHGPLPADTVFLDVNQYDVIVGMYHDQVLGPIKALDFWNTVNITLGLPFVRTSPDHGTAHTLAGYGTADMRSVTRALRMAASY